MTKWRPCKCGGRVFEPKGVRCGRCKAVARQSARAASNEASKRMPKKTCACGKPAMAGGKTECWPCASARRANAGPRAVKGGEPEPTDALPGSPEKIAVLMARAAAGLSLFHKDDPTVEKIRALPCPAPGKFHGPRGGKADG
jgi:hypothetical protein